MTVYPMLDVLLAFMAVIGVGSLMVAVNDFGGAFLDWIRGKK